MLLIAKECPQKCLINQEAVKLLEIIFLGFTSSSLKFMRGTVTSLGGSSSLGGGPAVETKYL